MFKQLWSYILGFFEVLLIIFNTLPRDILGLYKLIRHKVILYYNALLKRDFIAIFRRNVKLYGSKPCFILDERILSFQDVC